MYEILVRDSDTMIGLSTASGLKPVVGEKTGQQSSMRGVASTGNQAVSYSSGLSMFFTEPPAGDYDLYEKISKHPTVAEVMALVLSPVINNEWLFCKKDNDVSDEWVDFIANQNAFGRDLLETLRNMCRALEYAWAPFEPVWKRDGRLIVLDELKPLDPKRTKPLRDSNNNIVGLRNWAVDEADSVDLFLATGKAYWFSNDSKFGDPYGKSRHENIREYWHHWKETERRLARYLTKIAAIIVQLHYPAEEESFDPSSARRPNEWIAQQRLGDVSEGKSLAFPNLYASMASTDPEAAAKLAGESQWKLSSLELGKADFSKGIVDSLSYYDKLLFRGWLRPERTGLEAQKAGSRADSQSQQDIAVLDSEVIGSDLARSINKDLIDRLLVWNFGEKARGAVYARPRPISNESAAAQDKIIQAAFSNQQVGPLLAEKIDWDEWLDDRDIPILDEKRGAIDMKKVAAVAKALASGKSSPMADGTDVETGTQQLSLKPWQQRFARQKEAIFEDAR